MNKAVLFLLATTIGLGIISLHLVRTLRAEREQVSSLQARVDQLQRAQAQAAQAREAQWSAQTPFERVPDSAAASSPFGTVSPAATPAAASASPAAVTAPVTEPPPARQQIPSREERMRYMVERMKQQRELLRDPEYRDAMRSQRKLAYAQSHPDLEQALDMTPEQLDQLTTLLADQELRAMENIGPWVAGPSDQSEMQERMRKAQLQQQKNEAELANLLGPTKLQAWKDYQQSLGARYEVTRLRSVLASKGVPLQEERVGPLVKALAYEQQQLAKETNPAGAVGAVAFSASPGVYVGASAASATGQGQEEIEQRQLEHMTKYYQRLRDAAASVLSPEQLQAFEEQQNAQLKMQQMQLRMMRMQMESQGQGNAAGVSVNVAIP